MQPKIAIIMGSKSDWPTMKEAADILDRLGVDYHVEVVSAHRTPDKLMSFSASAADNGYQVRRICRAWWRLKPVCRFWVFLFRVRL